MNSLNNFNRLIKQYPKIIIYGAGLVARELFEWMKCEQTNTRVKYFAVTYLGDNPTHIEDVPVRNIDSIVENNTDVLVIVATLLNAQKEIGDTLQRLGFNTCVFITSDIRKK
jgi:FlaA1/EpsC-like NDP-sugar epimerase